MSKVAARLDRGLGRLGRFERLYKGGADKALVWAGSEEQWQARGALTLAETATYNPVLNICLLDPLPQPPPHPPTVPLVPPHPRTVTHLPTILLVSPGSVTTLVCHQVHYGRHVLVVDHSKLHPCHVNLTSPRPPALSGCRVWRRLGAWARNRLYSRQKDR